MVPFLNAILGTMLPMLNMAKQDNMKWVFSSGRILENTLPAVQLLMHQMFLKMTPFDVCVSPALCHFSDSILEYLANLDKAPDPTVRKDTFSSEIYAAFEILFNNWLQSRESKVRTPIHLVNSVSCVLIKRPWCLSAVIQKERHPSGIYQESLWLFSFGGH